MNLIFVAALIAACGAAKLDRTYLPPTSSQYAGGPPGSLHTPFVNTRIQGFFANQGFLQAPFGRTSESNPSQGNLPSGSYENQHQGVVVEAAAPGTRASNQPSGLGGPRENYGSTDSKVGEAAFRGTKNQAKPSPQYQGGQLFQFQPNRPASINNQDYPDLSAFYQPTGQINTGYKPGNQLFTDRVSNTVKYHMNIGLNKFNYGFETENGIKMEENGVSSDGVQTQGGYSYTGDDGKVYSVKFTADKDGYKPVGAHLPTPPPIPAEILESLQQNARDEANGINDDGSYDAQKYNTEDDYAQSDTNGDYNERQSNKRLESNSGASAIINQVQQGFVRPNGQGQFNSYDFSQDLSLTQPDASKFGTGVSRFDNEEQPNKVAQTESNTGASQRQQGFVRPNGQGQFNSYDFSQDLSLTQPDASKFGTGVSRFDDEEQPNKVAQTESNTGASQGQQGFVRPNGQGQFNSYDFSQDLSLTQPDASKFGTDVSRFDDEQQPNKVAQTESNTGASQGQQGFVTPINVQDQTNNYDFSTVFSATQPGNFASSVNQTGNTSNGGNIITLNEEIQSENKFENQSEYVPPRPPGVFLDKNSKVGFYNNFVNSLPQSEKVQQPFGTPIPTIAIPTSYVQQSSNNNILSSIQGSSSFGFNTPQNDATILQTSTLSSPVGSAFGLESESNAQNSVKAHRNDSFASNVAPVNNVNNFQSQASLPTSFLNFGVSSQNNLNDSPQTQIPFSQDSLLSITGENANLNFNNRFSSISSQIRPTKQPELILTTPLDNQDQQTNSGSPLLAPSSIDNQPLEPFSSSFGSSQSIFSRPNKPSNGQFLQKIPGQPQRADNSYIYNKPLTPFNIASTQNSGTPSRFPTQYQSITGSNKYPQISNSAPIFQTTANKQDVTEINTQPSNGITQASILSFSPITTSSSQTSSGDLYEYTKPEQGLPTSSQEEKGGVLNSQQQNSELLLQNDDFLKPQGNKQSNTPFGQRFPTISTPFETTPTLRQFDSQSILPFGSKPTLAPFVGITSTSLNQQTKPISFGVQTTSSFGQDPNVLPFNTQTSSLDQSQTSFSFGQQSTPSRLGTQISSAFGQNLRQPQTDAEKNNFSFGSQTTSSRISVQPTISTPGRNPALPVIGTSLNQQTTPTSFGSQTSSVFGQPTIPSQFGFQTSSTSGQNPIQSQQSGQNNFSFGSQSIPPRFGTNMNSLFGQQTTTPKFGTPSSSLSGQRPTPSSFGIQTSTVFGQKTTPSRFNVQTGSSAGQTSSRFGTQTISGIGQQTTSLPLDIQTNTAFEQKITGSQFNDETQATTQFGDDLNKKQQNQSQKSNEQTKNKSDSKPSIFRVCVACSLNSRKPVENTKPGEIYQYNKPTTALPSDEANKLQTNFGSRQSQINSQFNQQGTSSENENSAAFDEQYTTTVLTVNRFGSQLPQLGSKPNNQESSQQSQSTTQQYNTINEQNLSSDSVKKPVTNSNFGFPQPTSSANSVIPTSSSEIVFDNVELNTSNELTNTDNTKTQSSSITSGSENLQGSLDLEQQEQSQNSESGEVYNYNKPAQSLPDSSQDEGNQNGQITSQIQFDQTVQNRFDSSKPFISQSSQNKGETEQLPITSQPSQTTSSSILGVSLPSSHPFPHLAFYSACCRGPKPQNKPGSQSFSGKVPTSPLNDKLAGNNFGNNKNDEDINGSGLDENRFGNQGFEVQKDTTSFVSKGEEFGGPRKPPKFDETGYHY